MIGRKTRIVDPRGGTYLAHFRVVPLDELKVSPDFRRQDLSGDELAAQLYDHASHYDPALTVNRQVGPNVGPPVVGPDLEVEAGNGRVDTLHVLRGMDDYGRYSGYLAARAVDFGLDRDAVEAGDWPVLVRERRDGPIGRAERTRFARWANVSPEGFQQFLGRTRRDASTWTPFLSKAVLRGAEDLNAALEDPSNRRAFEETVRTAGLVDLAGMLTMDEQGRPAFTESARKRLTVAALAGVLDDATLLYELAEDI